MALLFTQTAPSSLGNSATEASLFGTGVGTTTLPTSFLTPGTTLRITAQGAYYTSSAAPGGLRFTIRVGSNAVLQTSFTAPGSAQFQQFLVEGLITCRSRGAAGTIWGQGMVTIGTSPAGTQQWPMLTFPTSVTALNTTLAQSVHVMATWGTAAASHTLFGTHGMIELLS